ncbi:MAG: TRAP transporter small permease [Deferribacteres bacterium]|nr:TRAP transporter small permease [candidate division KSB1 bacterium]MCB9509093.1 TRAP transporter small permease [Deferribacteres bacterium]
MAALKVLKNMRAKLDKTLEVLLIILMGFMVLNVLWQVFSRYILQDPSSITDELARFQLIWLGLLGACYAVGKKTHLAIELFGSGLSAGQKLLSDLFIQIVIFLFALLVMVIGGFRLMQITLVLNQVSAALQIQIGYVYSILPISGLVMMFYSITFMLDDLAIFASEKRA